MKKIFSLLLAVMILIVASIGFAGCNKVDDGNEWTNKYDISMPNVTGDGFTPEYANADGWYTTLYDGFDSKSLSSIWSIAPNAPHGDYTYWCDDMVSLRDGYVVINAENGTDHKCDIDDHNGRDIITSSIMTYQDMDSKRIAKFEQAYGYYEIRAKIPDTDGLWATFGLDNVNSTRVGAKGKDGARINVFESCFYSDRTIIGNAVHFNDKGIHHRSVRATHSVGIDTYEDFHIYSLKWTPNEYVFYFDGEPVWATDAGGVCEVPCYLYLACEGGTKAPHEQTMGTFTGGEFVIDYVHVYQNKSYLEHIKSLKDYK